jgi:hypothetical protein
MFTIAGLGGAYMIVKARTLAIKQQEKEVRDYSVSVDRSGRPPTCFRVRVYTLFPIATATPNTTLFHATSIIGVRPRLTMHRRRHLSIVYQLIYNDVMTQQNVYGSKATVMVAL